VCEDATTAAQIVAGGFFPLDRQLGLTDSVYSPGMNKDMVWLGGLVPYDQAVKVFERIGHRSIPRTSLWRESQIHGERLKTHLEREQARVKPERVVLPPPGQDHHRALGISMDGGMVNIRDEGWKEIKVGAVFEVGEAEEQDPITGERVAQATAMKVEYAPVLGSVDEFGPALWQLAVKRGVPQAARTSVTADGATWIWNVVADYFPDSEQIVDWYHACQHLAQGATALYPKDEDKADRWFREHQTNLFQGEIHTITAPLDEHDLTDCSRYFHTHQRRMRYQEFREEGYPIGSGTVESGIKRFKSRLTGAGMRWSRPGAERMLVIRGAVMADTFDELWAAA
jgi:hypothetical protein